MESSEVLAAKLLEFMGGKENIISVTHCATRLRPQLKDRSLVDADAIEKLDGVTGLVNKDSGLQIIIGEGMGFRTLRAGGFDRKGRSRSEKA